MIRQSDIGSGSEFAPLRIEEVTDPIEIEQHRIHVEAFRLNSEWLEKNWHTLLPQARGRFVAVAGQEGHVAETAEEAIAWAAQAHPEDISPLVQFVLKELGPRIYANIRQLAHLR